MISYNQQNQRNPLRQIGIHHNLSTNTKISNYQQLTLSNQKTRSKSIGGFQKRKVTNFEQRISIAVVKPKTIKLDKQKSLNNLIANDRQQYQENCLMMDQSHFHGYHIHNNLKNSFKKLTFLDNINKLSFGQNHFIYIDNKGNIHYKDFQGKDEQRCWDKINRFFNHGFQKCKNIFSTPYCTFVITEKDELFGFGLNDRSQLGLGKLTKQINGIIDEPKKIQIFSTSENVNSNKIKNSSNSKNKITPSYYNQSPNLNESIEKIVGGPFHTLVLTSFGRLFYSGQIYTEKGLENNQYYHRFVEIPFKIGRFIENKQEKVIDIQASLTSIGILTSQNRLLIMGMFGQSMFYNQFTDLQISIEQLGRIQSFCILNDIIYLIDSYNQLYSIDLCKRIPKILNRTNDINKEDENDQIMVDKMYQSSKDIIFKAIKNKKSGQIHEFYRITDKIQLINLDFPNNAQILDIFIENNQIFYWLKCKNARQFQQNYHKQLVQEQQLSFSRAQIKLMMEKLKQLERKNQRLNKKLVEKTTAQLLPKKCVAIQTQSNQLVTINTSKLPFHFKQSLNLQKQIIPRTFDPSLQITFSSLKLDKKIAEGGYGIIYKGGFKKTEVAVKIFKIQQNNLTAIKDFISECYAMEVLRHPNIVQLIGVCLKPPNYAVVMEYCEGGTLWTLLQNKKLSLGWDQKLRLSLQIAKAMNYLHDRQKPIVHRDLKSLNILLDSNRRVKLADFGWTKGLQNYMTSKIGTYQWMAPEVIASQQYTEKADVFSYAIILWEIASREPPYRNIQGLQVAYDVLNNNLRPPIPQDIPVEYNQLIKKCWQKQPMKRPSFIEIIDKLEEMIKNI